MGRRGRRCWEWRGGSDAKPGASGQKRMMAQKSRGRPNSKRTPRTSAREEKMALTPSMNELRRARVEPAKFASNGAR